MVAYTVLADPTVSVVTGRGTHSALLRACSTDSWERSEVIFHREAISQRVRCVTEIGTMFSVPVTRKCSLTKPEEHLWGPYLDTWLL